MEVGRVTDSRTPAVPEGTLVAMAYGHRTGYARRPAGRPHVVPLPTDLDPLLGIYVAHMGPICANGLLHAAADVPARRARARRRRPRAGACWSPAAGVVGLLTGLFARAPRRRRGRRRRPDAGAPRGRRGARPDGARRRRRTTWRASSRPRWRHGPGDRGADVVFQCRGQAAALATALRCLRPQGTVIDLAFYQGGADEVRLGEEFHHNGLAIRCAQIGRVPRGLAPAGTARRLSAETLALLRAPRRRPPAPGHRRGPVRRRARLAARPRRAPPARAAAVRGRGAAGGTAAGARGRRRRASSSRPSSGGEPPLGARRQAAGPGHRPAARRAANRPSSSASQPVTPWSTSSVQGAPAHRHHRHPGGQRLKHRGSARLLPAQREHRRPGGASSSAFVLAGATVPDPADGAAVELRRDLVRRVARVGVVSATGGGTASSAGAVRVASRRPGPASTSGRPRPRARGRPRSCPFTGGACRPRAGRLGRAGGGAAGGGVAPRGMAPRVCRAQRRDGAQGSWEPDTHGEEAPGRRPSKRRVESPVLGEVPVQGLQHRRGGVPPAPPYRRSRPPRDGCGRGRRSGEPVGPARRPRGRAPPRPSRGRVR